jgi:hypothetical protein
MRIIGGKKVKVAIWGVIRKQQMTFRKRADLRLLQGVGSHIAIDIV